jgi:hypothetical protein
MKEPRKCGALVVRQSFFAQRTETAVADHDVARVLDLPTGCLLVGMGSSPLEVSSIGRSVEGGRWRNILDANPASTVAQRF